ncbi:MAG: hypothetical protein JSV65_04880 [Armatimonadota bacterium]|nr:MAG: hypothetical protein JSV65_04880 [Armatimonadota bacterium]
MIRLAMEFPYNNRLIDGSSSGYAIDSWLRPGMGMPLGSGGATRGCRPAASYWLSWGRNLDSAIITQKLVPFLGRVTAVGTGSVLAVGAIVFGISVHDQTTAMTEVRAGAMTWAVCATDLYQIPSVLL